MSFLEESEAFLKNAGPDKDRIKISAKRNRSF